MLPASSGSRPRDGSRTSGPLVAHPCGSYCQITYLPGAGANRASP